MPYFAPLSEGELLSLHWDLIILLQNRPIETNGAWNGTCTPEWGKVGVLVLHIHPQSISSGLTVLPPPANKYVMYSQVKLPISLSSRPRPGGHILFSAGTIICEHFVPSFGQENIMAQIEVLPELTQ